MFEVLFSGAAIAAELMGDSLEHYKGKRNNYNGSARWVFLSKAV